MITATETAIEAFEPTCSTFETDDGPRVLVQIYAGNYRDPDVQRFLLEPLEAKAWSLAMLRVATRAVEMEIDLEMKRNAIAWRAR